MRWRGICCLIDKKNEVFFNGFFNFVFLNCLESVWSSLLTVVFLYLFNLNIVIVWWAMGSSCDFLHFC